eukprot:Seg2052.3 transcript_id=Seg2052.3/GoldUCD/mRNA.D3Y31 product="hypothetical protein" protein_id=Seg2052.3/GoldUCD/D3Y31
MANETNEEEALIVYESLKSDLGQPRAKKRWEILRRAILSNYDTSEKNEVDILPALKVKARESRERKRKLQAKLATIIETAREELEQAELKAEKVTTTYKEVVTDLRRKITIAEHRKIIENAFAGGQSTIERRMSVNDVAQGMRIVRQMEATQDRIRARKNFLKKAASKRSLNSPIVSSKREEANSSVESKREDDISSEEDKRKENVPSSESNHEEKVSSAESNKKRNVSKDRKKNRQSTKKREKATTVNKDEEKEAPGKESKRKENVSSVDSKTGETVSSAECNRDENVAEMGNKREEKASREDENREKDALVMKSKRETKSEGAKGSQRGKGNRKNGIKITKKKKKDGSKDKEGKKSKKKIEKESFNDHKECDFDDDAAGEVRNDFGEVMTSMGFKRNASKPAKEENEIHDKGIMHDFEDGGQIIAISREIQKHHKNLLKDEIKNKMKLPSVSESLHDDEDGKSCGDEHGNSDSVENDLDPFHDSEEQDLTFNGNYDIAGEYSEGSFQNSMKNHENDRHRDQEKDVYETHPNDDDHEDETVMADTFGRSANQDSADSHIELSSGCSNNGINFEEKVTEFGNKFENDTRHFTSVVESHRNNGEQGGLRVLEDETSQGSENKINNIEEDLFIVTKQETKESVASIHQRDGGRLEKGAELNNGKRNMEESREFIKNLQKTPDTMKNVDILSSTYRNSLSNNKEINSENNSPAAKYGHELLEELSGKVRNEYETEAFNFEQKRRPSSLKMPRNILQDFVLNNRVQRTKTYAESSSFDMKHTSIKELLTQSVDEKEVFETTTSGSSPSGTSMSPFKRSSKRDSGYCESTLSSLVLTGTYSWSFNQNPGKGIEEIFNGLREMGLDARADELEDTLMNLLETQRSLRQEQKDTKKSIEDEKNKQRKKEREELKIRKMKTAYERFKEKERERREFEELQRLLREEAKRRLERYQKLHRERMMLAIDNNISRQYKFSYFSNGRNARRRKESDQKLQ